MILQALNDYYQRLVNDPDQDVPLPGFGEAKISFSLVLDRDGNLLDIQDLREQRGNRLVPRIVRAPQAVKKSVNIAPNFLWDNTSYVMGADEKGKPERTAQSFQAFKELVHHLGDDLDDSGVKAVLSFLDKWNPNDAVKLDLWEEMAGQNLVFRLDGDRGFVHENPNVRKAWVNHWGSKDVDELGQCLLTGQRGPLARLHPSIKGVRGAQTSGANLVSFNLDAFTSYGKEQSYNAPVSTEAAFAYTTVLNRLLSPDSRQKIQIGDASVVFWSRDDSPAVELLGLAIGGNKGDDAAVNQQLAEFLKAARQGVPFAGWDPDNPFYILGLSPNASRLSIRFWHQSTVGEMQKRLGEHLQDLEMVRLSDKQPEHPPVWMLLRETAAQGKSENVPPQLAGEFARAVLTGRPYPRILLTALVGRIRADKEIGYLRAALIKAYLSRQYRLSEVFRKDQRNKEVFMSLDTQRNNPAYRLGRLFAVLEDLQRSALGLGINATIRDKYLSSASSAPRATFPQLLRLAQAHIKKSQWGGKYDRDIQMVLEEVGDFPTTLNLEQQGLFFLGYYHQKAHRPTKTEADKTAADEAADDMEE